MSWCLNVFVPKCLGPKLLGAEMYGANTFWCLNVLLPKRLRAKCFGAVLLPYSFNHHCTIIQKDHGGGAKQDVKLCNTVLNFPHPQNQSIKKQTA